MTFRIWQLFILCLGLLTPLVMQSADELIYPLKIGAVAPDFNLPGVDGKVYSLKDFKDFKILFIVFTANHCPTAQSYEDRIIQLVKDYRNKGVGVVAIAPNDPLAVRLDEMGYTDLGDSMEDMKIRAKDKGFNFPYLFDGETEHTSRLYGPVSTPHVFIFDQQRKLRYQGWIDNSEKIGAATKHDARNAIEALLQGKPVPVENTKTFGCSIKWSDKRSGVKQETESLAQEPVKLESIDLAGVGALAKNSTHKLRLINVWATWCAPCLVEIPELAKIYHMYRNRDVEVITISADDPERRDKVLKALQERKASIRNFFFNSSDKDALSNALDKEWPGGFPYTVLIAPGGKILHRQMGEIDPLKLKKAIVQYIGRYYQ
jgi:thiol-disulfide isomerase/thioredoxin